VSLIYHIADSSDWARARQDGSYEISTRGVTLAREGYIHASAAGQVARVANAYYAGVSDLVVLEIDTDLVEPDIRWERPPGADEEYPHIYGPLTVAAVVRVLPLAPDASGRFRFASPAP
jgi:uncharacterized protein (DUF952 family)